MGSIPTISTIVKYIMAPKLMLECGPLDDRRTLNIQLNFLKRRIGVLVSGGLDSALLYYLIQSLVNDSYTVTPFIINRPNDGSSIYAQPVIDYVNSVLNKPPQVGTKLYITEDNSELQVTAGMRELVNHNVNINYIGLIETLPIHCIGVPGPYKPVNSEKFIFPFKDLNKSHVVDLICQLNQHELFSITHSCVYNENRCGKCNRCNERQWAFTKLGLVDPGTS